uniref:Uncharacterized protein n=1 Tax=Panagrolaimus sp. PS1159 TaxID=55785 RepID=A0AC35G7Q8_9BILA
MTSSNEKKKVPLIQFIKVDEASTSESGTKDLHTIKTEEEETMEQKKRDELSSKQQLHFENASSNNTSMPSSSFQSVTTASTSTYSELFSSSPTSPTSTASEAAKQSSKKFENKIVKKSKIFESMPEKCSLSLPNPESLKGAWKELKYKIRSAINTLKSKHNEIIAEIPHATSTPKSKASSASAAKFVHPTVRSSSDTTSSSKGSPPQNISFKEEEETQAAKSQRLIEYVLKNIKTHDRVSGIKISIEHRFNEIQ